MDQNQLQQKIVEYFQKLPKEAQVSFSSMLWMDKLREIISTNNLNTDQIEILGAETTLVLLGIVDIAEYKKILENELKLDKELFIKITTEIDNDILFKIKDQLTETFEANAFELTEEKYGGDKSVDERFNRLPIEVQEAINKSNYQETLYLIAKKYKISIEKMGILEEVTTKVMLGIIHPDKYEENLKSKLGLSDVDNHNLVLDVNEQILKTIKEALKASWDDNQKLNEDDLVPTPPYVDIIPKPIASLETSGVASTIKEIKVDDIYKDSGIEILGDEKDIVKTNTPTEIKVVPTEEKLIIPSVINMLKDKLNSPINGENSISNHSIPKINNKEDIIPLPPTPTTIPVVSKPHDPYHEEI